MCESDSNSIILRVYHHVDLTHVTHVKRETTGRKVSPGGRIIIIIIENGRGTLPSASNYGVEFRERYFALRIDTHTHFSIIQ